MSNNLHKKQLTNTMMTTQEIERSVERAISALEFVSFTECYIFAISRKFGTVGVKIEKTHNISPEGLSLLSQSVQELVSKSIQTTITYKDGRIEENGKIVDLAARAETEDKC
jgi:hypothetical protein